MFSSLTADQFRVLCLKAAIFAREETSLCIYVKVERVHKEPLGEGILYPSETTKEIPFGLGLFILIGVFYIERFIWFGHLNRF